MRFLFCVAALAAPTFAISNRTRFQTLSDSLTVDDTMQGLEELLGIKGAIRAFVCTVEAVTRRIAFGVTLM